MLKLTSNGPRRAQQNYHILRCHWPQRIAAADHGFPKHFFQPAGNKSCFLCIGILIRLQSIQFYPRVWQCNVVIAFTEGFRVRVLQTTDGWGHAYRKHIVYRGNHLTAGAEIIA